MTQWGLDTLFNPAKRHMDEEKRRLQSTREEVGDNSGGRRIDLESGRVTIAKQDADEAPNEPLAERKSDRAERPAKSAKDRSSAKDKPVAKDKPAAKEPTAAQKRAAERRGRSV